MKKVKKAKMKGAKTKKAKIKERRGIKDLSKLQELSIAVMNLISAEEHLAFTAMKTGREEYLKIYEAVRKLRSRLMKKLVKNKEAEAWCISKHLLATTIRLIETAIKSDDAEAKRILENALDTYKLFWLVQEIGGKAVGSKTTGGKSERSKRSKS